MMEIEEDLCFEIWNYTNITAANEGLAYLHWSAFDRLLILLVIPIVVIIGIVTNIAFLFTVGRVPHMQTVTNFYLVNLSIADILFMFITLVTYLHTFFYSSLRNNIPYESQHGCWANTYPIYLSYFASLTLVTLVSVERFFSICMPVKHRLISGKKRTVKLIIACWVLSFILAALTTPRYGRLRQKCIIWPSTDQFQNLPTVFRSCYLYSEGFALASEFIQCITFLVALLVSCITYFKLIQSLNQGASSTRGSTSSLHGKSLRGKHTATQKHNRQIRNQVARLLIINGIVFFLCQFPARVINMDKVFRVINGNLQSHYATLFAIANGLLLLNSAVNPFIYGLSSRFYRISFCRAFGIASFFKMDRSPSTTGASFASRTPDYSPQSTIRRNQITSDDNDSDSTANK